MVQVDLVHVKISMTYIFFEERVSVDELAKYFEEVDEELIDPFDFDPNPHRTENKKTYRISDWFKVYFNGRLCRYKKSQTDLAKIHFMQCLHEAAPVSKQMKKFKDSILNELDNFGLYQDEHKQIYEHDNTGNTNSSANLNSSATDKRDLKEAQLIGASDAATMSTLRNQTKKVVETKGLLDKSNEKYFDFLDPNARNVQHTVAIFGGSNTNTLSSTNTNVITAVGKSKGVTTNASSNPYKDRIEYLNRQLPSLTNRFLEFFTPLFHS